MTIAGTRARVLLSGNSLVNQALQAGPVKRIAAYFKRLVMAASLMPALPKAKLLRVAVAEPGALAEHH
jgi:hypothetical protein